jgi:hypothetical protein
LSEQDRTFRYLVFDRYRGQDHDGFDLTEDLAELYAAAARMAEQLAVNTDRYMADHGGHAMPGHPTPQEWQAQAEQFRSWEHQRGPR